MRYSQTNYRGASRRRRIGRIVLLCALTAAILVSVLVLGNILHDRLEEAAPLLALPAVTYSEQTEASPAVPAVRQPFVPGQTREGIYCTVDEAVLREADADALRESCAVAAELYDGLSVTVVGADGLHFALEAESGAANAASLPGVQVLRALCGAAAEYGLAVCAVWQLPDEVPETDSVTVAAARELAALGFDEILFTGLTAASLRERDVSAMTALSDAVKETAPDVRVGCAFAYDAFSDVDCAPSLETLAMHMDTVAVELGAPGEEIADDTEYARSRAAALYGSIAYYPLRILLRGSTASLSAQSAALQEAGYGDIQPVS